MNAFYRTVITFGCGQVLHHRYYDINALPSADAFICGCGREGATIVTEITHERVEEDPT